jgi:hypothetical protein
MRYRPVRVEWLGAPVKPNVSIDNTRIESGRNTSGGGNLNGIWMQGQLDLAVRNSVIARVATGILFDPLFSVGSDLTIVNSEITRTATGVQLNASQANSSGRISIAGSQLTIQGTGIAAAISGACCVHTISVTDSHVAYSGTGVQLQNSGGSSTELHMDFVRSQNVNSGNIAFDLNATNGSATTATLRDSTVSNGGTLIKTSGSTLGGGGVLAGLVHSTLQLADTAIDHGFGYIQLDGSRITMCGKDIVDSGGGAASVVSLNNNFIYMCGNPPGPTYITPSIIPTK